MAGMLKPGIGGPQQRNGPLAGRGSGLRPVGRWRETV